MPAGGGGALSAFRRVGMENIMGEQVPGVHRLGECGEVLAFRGIKLSCLQSLLSLAEAFVQGAVLIGIPHGAQEQPHLVRAAPRPFHARARGCEVQPAVAHGLIHPAFEAPALCRPVCVHTAAQVGA